jgi:hypothetical protein
MMNELGRGHPNVSAANYLLGEKRRGTGFWYYYLLFFLSKPNLVVLLPGSAIFFLFVRKKSRDIPAPCFFCFHYFFIFVCAGCKTMFRLGSGMCLMVYPLTYVLWDL